MNTWIIGARPRTLPAAVVPVALGAAAAVGIGTMTWWRVAACLIVSVALQVGVNYANDYSDGVRGTDDVRVGPTRLVASGLASPAAVKRAAFVSFGVAAVAGLAIALDTSLVLLVVGAAAIAAGWFYTGGAKALRVPRAWRGLRLCLLRSGRHRRVDLRRRRKDHCAVGCGRVRRWFARMCLARDQQPA